MATDYAIPGIYIEEVSTGPRPIQAVGTSTVGFVGTPPDASSIGRGEAIPITNWTQFVNRFCGKKKNSNNLAKAVFGFFDNGGTRCYIAPVDSGIGEPAASTGIHALAAVDEIAMVAAPGYTNPADYSAILGHCEDLGDRIAILDAPEVIEQVDELTKVALEGADTGKRPRQSDGGFGAFYYPWLVIRDPLDPSKSVTAPPSGHMAGIYARTDARRGVHKAPANEPVRGALNLVHRIARADQGILNKNGVNAIRFFGREGIRVWGARTLAAAASEWRYVNVRRLFNMIEESIAEGTRWVVFEPNDATLWKSIVRDISAFLLQLWRAGALVGATPEEAFFVQCDAETNPPEVVNAGQVVAVIGIAPVKPAEFIIFRIGQQASPSDQE